jgi:hypothetical protein
VFLVYALLKIQILNFTGKSMLIGDQQFICSTLFDLSMLTVHHSAAIAFAWQYLALVDNIDCHTPAVHLGVSKVELERKSKTRCEYTLRLIVFFPLFYKPRDIVGFPGTGYCRVTTGSISKIPCSKVLRNGQQPTDKS